MIGILKKSLKPIKDYFSNSNYRAFEKLYEKYGRYERYRQTTVSTIGYTLTVPDPLSFVWQFKEIFTDSIYHFKSAKTNPLILDCGANIGLSVLYFKKLYPHAMIKAYEADPKIGVVLQQNLAANHCSDVEVISKAVWINNNGVSFSSEGADGGSIFGNAQSVQIPSVRLKDELSKYGEVDLLKIDIEGAEYDVLKDCKDALSHVKHLFVEYHSFYKEPQKLNDILSILSEAGFRYHIHSLSNLKSPLSDTAQAPIDLQLNIFCSRFERH